ncbi:MAG: aldo/keto reductase [Muricauda sp.]|jgi:predicted oxidoreductase|nr:aldo/keto reductase [Allomuricauda sp.]MAU26643.1 aldo/keto reductase [Allomuricauda sp.]MBC30190.1 aldo/keto reductase [Allomuricauda sp.]|tara:strand:+ start:453 stop:1310 length:858 start_codon:yes stop_codon:yes gene_type:complete
MFSRIIAGTMTWGSWGKQLSQKEMVDLMQHCLEIGITSFDHADIYGDYQNEQVFGDAFAESGIAREQVQFISKCGIQMTQGRNNMVKHYQYDRAYIIWSVEESLKKLKTDYLDLMLLHRPSPLMHPDEIAQAVQTLMKDGKIKQFGVSNFTPSQIALIETHVPVEANQVEFSLLHCDPMYDGTFDDCIINKRKAMAWSPLGGFFSGNSEQKHRLTKVLSTLVKKYGVAADVLLLTWLMRHPSKVFPVVGTTNKERLSMARQATQIELGLEDWFMLLEASLGHEVP